MNRERALALQKRGLHDWIAVLGASSPGARTVDADGVVGAIVPACPQRSICNSVSYESAEALGDALERLDAIYEEAGVAAWTVWVPEFDREAIDLLEGAGHVLDGAPVAMSVELDRFAALDLGDLDWDTDVDPLLLGRLNDLAYGIAGVEGMATGLSAPAPQLRLYQAKVEGEPACVLGTIEHDRDLGFYFVATHPERRRRGLATRLITAAVNEARERGLATSSLQGSAMGQSLYRRLGYQDDFALHMYERRR